MFFIVLKKLLNNRWLVICLLVGTVLAVAMVSAVPLYTDGILHRMLQKDLQQYQLDRKSYPGKYIATVKLYPNYTRKEGQNVSTFEYFAKRFKGLFPEQIGVDILQSTETLKLEVKIDPESTAEKRKFYLNLTGMSGLMDHAEIVKGREPAKEAVDGVYECLVTERIQELEGMQLGQVYQAEDITKQIQEPILVKPVGIIKNKYPNDVWWYRSLSYYKESLFIDYDLFVKDILREKAAISGVEWHYSFDYTTIKVDQLSQIIEAVKEQEQWIQQYAGADIRFRVLEILEDYFAREKRLVTTLWVLQVPILLMLCFYIFMVSQLVIENEKDEIAILKSRGSSRGQIFGIYTVQSTLLAVVSAVIGPLLAIGVCQIIGASNGFLELVSRSRLPIVFRPRVVTYTLTAGVFAILMMLVPAMMSARASIVELKQKKASRWKAPLWQKTFLDVIFIGVSLYGLYNYNIQQQVKMATEVEGMVVPVDPMLFGMSTLFILGAGLLFLRIYPYIIRVIYWIGRRVWPPVLYTSFVHVGRSGGKEHFLMLFLILTLSIGIFSANSARTINQNIEDRVKYEIGADMRLQQKWPNNDANTSGQTGGMPSDEGSQLAYGEAQDVIYKEPPFEVISGVKGFEKTTKVLIPDDIRIKTNKGFVVGTMMAIEPHTFGEVAQSIPGLFPRHINEYLNVLTEYPNLVFASSALREDKDVEVGDTITYMWASQQVDGIVCAFVDHWLSLDPVDNKEKYFVIANLQYVQNQTALAPYEVWVKRDKNVSTEAVYKDIEDKDLSILWLKDTRQDTIKKKNDPMLQGMNGAMTMGFLVTMGISLIGFIIYWILSVKSRVLQFGIFRAMGMTKWNVIAMIVVEQVLISLVAIFVGIIVGGLTCDLFVPMLQMVYSASEQAIPFRIVAARQDYFKIYGFVLVMLLSGFGILGWIISRIRIAQAIKLGED